MFKVASPNSDWVGLLKKSAFDGQIQEKDGQLFCGECLPSLIITTIAPINTNRGLRYEQSRES